MHVYTNIHIGITWESEAAWYTRGDDENVKIDLVLEEERKRRRGEEEGEERGKVWWRRWLTLFYHVSFSPLFLPLSLFLLFSPLILYQNIFESKTKGDENHALFVLETLSSHTSLEGRKEGR
jgi:hypothetical protein